MNIIRFDDSTFGVLDREGVAIRIGLKSEEEARQWAARHPGREGRPAPADSGAVPQSPAEFSNGRTGL